LFAAKNMFLPRSGIFCFLDLPFWCFLSFFYIFLHLCVYTIFYGFETFVNLFAEIFCICLFICFSWSVCFPSSYVKYGWDYNNIILIFNDKQFTFCKCFSKPPTRKVRGRECQLGLLQC
jgi:hypothetical protein